ncbi:hypothetical protein LCGC14_0336850 [marine sediment metagenome]|uniref:VRR-NUC domain-containing protein n=1 Tax=marine sediment metagenome TaxID=412755 RepID=A0A0F9TF74_9ZZZZ
MTPEGKLAKQIKDYLDGRKAKHELWWFKVHGHPMQESKIPDTIVIIHGHVLFLEAKAGGKKPDKGQLQKMRLIEEAGGTCRVVWTLDDAKDAVNEVMDRRTAEIGKEKP